MLVLASAGAMLETREPAMGEKGARPVASGHSLPGLDVSLPSPADALVVSGEVAPSVHAVSVVELPDARLRAFWFGGSREGARDVSIYSSVLPPGGTRWSDPVVAVERARAAADLGRPLRKLGNPVAAMVGDRLWLFYVSVSVGGWSGSAINATWSDDMGSTWSLSQRLVCSPFANLSTLVKAPPVDFGEGYLGLPVYHEMVAKFPQILRIDCSGDRPRVEGRETLPGAGDTIQPWMVPGRGGSAVAFLRRAGGRDLSVHVTRTTDGGGTWSEPIPCGDLANPGAAVAAADLGAGSILLAFNDTERGRHDLSLAVTHNEGLTWQRLGSVEDERRRPDEENEERLEYSYPWLLRTRGGEIHLFYTWNRRQIRHLRVSVRPVAEKAAGGVAGR